MNPEFYEDEVIEGFYVPSMIKMAWGAQLDVLAETDAICRRHDIPYFADWGTLLAAIRHGGYIPWDDDLDISMRRRDYERFLRYAEEELPEGFKVMNFKNHPGHHFFVARIVGKPRICFEEDHLTRFHGFPYIAGIDLFVLDNVSSDRIKEKLKAKKAEYVITVADNIADGKTTGKQAREQIAQCETYTGRRIDRRLSGEALRIRMYELAEELFASIPDKKADALVQMMPLGLYGNERYIPKEYYRKTVRLPYMNTTIPVPVCYDKIMRMKYGNYMRICRGSGIHDYPFFYGQHRDLLKVLDFEYPAYKASFDDVMPRPKEPADGDDGEGVKDIVFLPFAAKYWKYMEKLYRYYAGKPGCNVHVIPLPYYYKAWDGSPADEVFDTSAYPSDIQIEDYRSVDLGRMRPSVTVIQNPFDEWNPAYSVPPAFYSKRLRSFTDKLVYIPFFVTDDFTKKNGPEYVNMDHYVCMPGVICADRVILPSETLKETYKDKIREFVSSDAPELDAALDEKIKVCPEYVCGRDDEEGTASQLMPDDGRKTLVYCLTISYLAEKGQEAIDRIQKNLDMFESSSDRIRVIWITQCCRDCEELLDKETAEGFAAAVDRFLKMDIGRYIEDLPMSENRRYAAVCDAYYGDPSTLALQFYYAHKPVMIRS